MVLWSKLGIFQENVETRGYEFRGPSEKDGDYKKTKFFIVILPDNS